MTVELPPIDDVRTAIGEAMSECEVYCVSACCGMDAYQITPENLRRWADRVSRSTFDDVSKQLDRAIENLQSAPETFFFLDTEHSRADVLDWFRRIRAAFAAARAAD